MTAIEQSERGTEELALFEGDAGDRSLAFRKALNALIAKPVILNRKDPVLFKAIDDNRDELARDLSNHFLRLRLERDRGVAWAEHVDDMPDDVPKIKWHVGLHRNTQVLLVMLRLEMNSSELSGEEVFHIEKKQIYDYFKTHLYPDELDETRIQKAVESAIDEATKNKCLEEVNERTGIYRVTEVLPSWLTLQTVTAWTERFDQASSAKQSPAANTAEGGGEHA